MAVPLAMGLWSAVIFPLHHADAQPQPAVPEGSVREDSGEDAGALFTLEDIMRHPQWLGRPPERPFWSSDSSRIYFERDVEIEGDFDPRQRRLWEVEVGVDDAEPRLVPLDELHLTDSSDGSWNAERSRYAYARAGDIYVHDLVEGRRRQLTRTVDDESRPFHLADGRIGFSRGSDVLARDLDSGLETELFVVRASEDPLTEIEEAERKADYLGRQQRRLIRWLEDEAQRKKRRIERDEELAREDQGRADRPWYVGEKRDVQRVVASPDGRHALVVLRDQAQGEPKRDQMPRYVTETGFVETDQVRPKVGQLPRPVSLALIDRDDQELVELDLSALPGITDDPLEELRKAADERERARQALDESTEERESGAGTDDPDSASKGKRSAKPDPRPVSLSGLGWNSSGSTAWVQLVSLDNKDRWIALVDLDDSKLVPVHRLTDDAWINWSFRDTGWLPDDETLFFLSEESGYSHLYLWRRGDAEPRQLTRGAFVVDTPQPSPNGEFVYVTAKRNHPGIDEVFRVSTSREDSTAELEPVTELGGLNSFVLSPDGSSLAVTHSTTLRPPELYLASASAESSAPPRRLTETISDDFSSRPWVEPVIVEVPSSNIDRPIYSRLYRPAEAQAGRSRPGVVFVHGAGYLQNAHQGWSNYFREFMFHSLLVERGYVVLDMDFRASAGYGRDWRTAIYRQMGTPELEDLQDGVRYLVENHGVDPTRVGVYGGSYGGFVTFMAMFREPGLFAAGAALRPVTDWAHYNHPYTSNILNTPELDPEAYERSSPIEFAEGLEGHLLICTGMLDDNVLFQDSVRLVQRLIELEKEHWEIAIYPVEPHGFREPESWLDEYRRILKLFETTIGQR